MGDSGSRSNIGSGVTKPFHEEIAMRAIKIPPNTICMGY